MAWDTAWHHRRMKRCGPWMSITSCMTWRWVYARCRSSSMTPTLSKPRQGPCSRAFTLPRRASATVQHWQIAQAEYARFLTRLALLVDDGGHDAEEGQRRGAGLLRPRRRQGRDHVPAGLRLPPRVHDGAPLVAHHLKGAPWYDMAFTELSTCAVLARFDHRDQLQDASAHTDGPLPWLCRGL